MPLADEQKLHRFLRGYSCQGKELLGRECHSRGAHDAFPQPEKWDEEGQLQRQGEIVANLDGGKIQAKGYRDNRTEERRCSEDRKAAEACAEGQAQGKFLWSKTLTKKMQ